MDLTFRSLVEVYSLSSETSVNFCQATWRYILENNVLHVHMSVAIRKILRCL
jgi:hypothetical protein